MSSSKLYYNNINLHNVGSRLDVSIANRIKSGQALNEYNRQVKLEIPLPPAQFKSTEEANLDASFQNTKAIANLSTFMYYNDATNALSDLIKHNEVVDFNNFYEQFKKAIGSRFLSYYEFIAFWDKFKENLTNTKSDILTIDQEKVKQLENGHKNKLVENNLLSLENGLDELINAGFNTDILPTNISKADVNKILSLYDINNNPKITSIESPLISEIEANLSALSNNGMSKSSPAYSALFKGVLKDFTKKHIELQKSHKIKGTTRNHVPYSNTNLLKIKNPIYGETNLRNLTIDNLREQAKKMGINIGNTLDKEKLIKKILKKHPGEGAGLHHFSMREHGISSKHSLKHRYSILKGEANAGNNNPNLHKELREIKRKLY